MADMTEKQNVLLIDDEESFCDILGRSLMRCGYTVNCANDSASALDLARVGFHDYAVVDLRIGQESGLSLIRKFKEIRPQMKIIILTGYASIATAVEAIKLGATHYLTKPADVEDIIEAFGREGGDEKVKPADNPISAQRAEWEHIQTVLQKYEGNISATAKAMGMHRRTLQRKLQKRPVNR